jgi:ABC-2 type transport system permease protein
VILVELRKLIRRPRTWMSIFLLVLLPTVVALFLKGTDVAPRPGQGTAFLAEVLTDGALFPAAALAIVLPVFLPIAVATVAGESIAGEAAGGTLRYLLIRPVSRTVLLVAKLVAVMVYVLLAVIIVAITGYVVGRLLFGPGTATTVSGTTGGGDPGQVSAFRTVAAVLYVGWSMLGVASVALFLSTFTESSLAASLGAIAVLVASGVLQALDAARSIQPYLPTRYWLSFIDLFREPILWRNVERGVALQAVYVVVFLAGAWANFTTRDIKA